MVTEPAGPPVPPELSTIFVPIRASLGPVAAEVESRVPKTFSDTTTERGIEIRYEVARDPIRLNMIGAGLHANTTMKYAMEACRGRFPCISCGFKEGRREAQIALHTQLNWDTTWRLRSSTRVLPVHYAKPCEVTWLGIDITKRFVAPVVEDQLALAARTIDRNTPAVASIKPYAEQIWSALQAPVELAPRTWLVLEPSEVALTPITGSGTTVTSTLALRALTRVVVGDKPAPPRRPLPALKGVAPPPSAAPAMRIPFTVELPYEEASRLASRELAGKRYTVNGRPLVIESLKLLPAANGKVIVEAMIDYRGGALRNYRGLIYLDGTPRFDPATSTVVIPDLEYSLDPKRRTGLIRAIAERAVHLRVRDRLRENAKFPLGSRVDAMRSELNAALTRPLAKGVTLRGRVDAIQPVAATPLANVLVVRVVATGAAEVDIKM